MKHKWPTNCRRNRLFQSEFLSAWTARPALRERSAVELLSPTAVGYGLAPIELPDNWLDDLRQRLENEWSAPLKQAGIRYRTVFETGSRGPAATLIAVAKDEHADLIVTGSRGLGGFGELLLGSVSHQLVLHAPMPVVVIPPEHRNVTVTAPAASELASVAAP